MLAARGPCLQRLSISTANDSMDEDHPSLLPATLKHCPQLFQLGAKDLWPDDATAVQSPPTSFVIPALRASRDHCQGQRPYGGQCRYCGRHECLTASLLGLQDKTHAPLIRCNQLSLSCRA